MKHEFICPCCQIIHSEPEFNEFCSFDCLISGSMFDSDYDEFGFTINDKIKR